MHYFRSCVKIQSRKIKSQSELSDRLKRKKEIDFMTILDENSSFELWANRWVKHKSIGMSFVYNRTIKSQVEHLIKAVGDIPVKDIMPMQLNDLIDDLATMNPNTNRPASKKYLKEICNDAIQIFYFVSDNCKDFNYNPATRIHIPKNSTKKERRSLTNKEVCLILALQHRARPAVLIMMLCGLRVGEVLTLRWDDIDFVSGEMHINKSTQRVSGNEYAVKSGTKNGKSRTIPVPKPLLKELTELREHSTNPLICTNTSGEFHTPCSWKRMFESYISDLNALNAKISKFNPNFKQTLDKITPHMLRHTYASMLYFSGVDVLTAQKLLGHADTATTLKIYTHLQEQTEKLSIEKFDMFISDIYNSDNGLEDILK